MNPFLEKAKRLSQLAILVDTTFDVRSDEAKELKDKIRSAELDNLFEAMAVYCSKDN